MVNGGGGPNFPVRRCAVCFSYIILFLKTTPELSHLMPAFHKKGNCLVN